MRRMDTTTEVITAGRLDPGVPTICAAHPAEDFTAGTAALLHQITGRHVVCVNVRGGREIAAMADQLEVVRRRLSLDPWVFWGMSGGGWIGQHYASRHPQGLAALILESACACFRARLADAACLLSPFHPSWRPALSERGLIAADSHDQAGDPVRTAWTEVPGVGTVFRRADGPALLVSPMPVTPLMRAAMPALWCFDARPWLGRLRTRTLVIAGTADPVVPLAHAQALQQGISGAQLAVIDGGGHVPTAGGDAQARAAVERFLSGGPGLAPVPSSA
jgi:pimeloyl-ACP methyl ester carboxylesterase